MKYLLQILLFISNYFWSKLHEGNQGKHTNMTLLDVLRNISDNCLLIVLNFPLSSFLAFMFRRALKENKYILLDLNTATLSFTLIRNSKNGQTSHYTFTIQSYMVQYVVIHTRYNCSHNIFMIEF
jgi:hypothetical protein